MQPAEPKFNFLTKKRYLAPKTKVFVVSFTCLLALVTWLYPSVYGAFQWFGARKSVYQSRTINLPFLWTQETLGRDVEWNKPRANAFEIFDSNVDVSDTFSTKSTNFDLARWKKLYGTLSDNDLNSIPEMNDLLHAGMTCGAVRSGQLDNQPSGVIAFGCLAKDQVRTFTFTGTRPAVGGAISIILQSQQ